MKKIALMCLVVIVSASPLLASACPKGTHPTGGSGSHHKGGTCV